MEASSLLVAILAIMIEKWEWNYCVNMFNIFQKDWNENLYLLELTKFFNTASFIWNVHIQIRCWKDWSWIGCYFPIFKQACPTMDSTVQKTCQRTAIPRIPPPVPHPASPPPGGTTHGGEGAGGDPLAQMQHSDANLDSRM